MATEEGAETTSPLDNVMEDTRRELVRRVAADDRDANRDIYDALEDESRKRFEAPFVVGGDLRVDESLPDGRPLCVVVCSLGDGVHGDGRRSRGPPRGPVRRRAL